MEKPAGALDFDDTIGPFAARFLEHINLEDGTDYRAEDITDHNLAISFGGSMKDDWYPRILDFANHERENPMEPIEGAVEVIGRLATKYELVIITARPVEQKDIVENFVASHLSEYVSDIFTRNGTKHDEFNKGNVMAHVGAEFLVDDHFKHVDNAIAQGRRGILFGDLPKTGPHRERLPYAATWYDVEALVEE